MGLYGILNDRELEAVDSTKPIAAMMEEDKKEARVESLERLPRSLEEARRLFAQDTVLREVLGDELVERYISVNEISLSRQLKRWRIADL